MCVSIYIYIYIKLENLVEIVAAFSGDVQEAKSLFVFHLFIIMLYVENKILNRIIDLCLCFISILSNCANFSY